MDAEPAAKRPRLSEGEPPLLAGEHTADAVLPGDAPPAATTTDTLPDEEHAAPPSSAAGAHAKPLSAIWAAKSPSPRKKRPTQDLKGKGKARALHADDDKENFTDLLERLETESELRSGPAHARRDQGLDGLRCPSLPSPAGLLTRRSSSPSHAASTGEQEKWGRPVAPKLNPQRDGFGASSLLRRAVCRPTCAGLRADRPRCVAAQSSSRLTSRSTLRPVRVRPSARSA